MTTQRQFFAQKLRKRSYDTVEIYHPSGVLLRYVTGRIDPIDFTLEASAPRNAGEVVEYTGKGFQFQQPDQNDTIVSADLQLGRVGSEVKQILKSIRGFDRAKVGEVIYRQFIDGPNSEPAKVIMLYIRSVTMTADGVVIRVEQDNPADRAVSTIYAVEVFKGLAENL